MKINKQALSGISILVGTAIGAGIFGIPYVTSQVGFVPGIFYIFILGFIILLVTVLYAEVTLRTKEKHQLPGYANIYLGKWGKRVALLALVISIYGALVAYTMEIGVFLDALLADSMGGSSRIYSLIFFGLASIAIYIGLKTVATLEKIMVGLLLLVIGLLFLFGVREIEVANYLTFDSSNLLLPYGVILFALGAGTAVPDARFLLRGQEKKLLRVVQIGIIIPIVIYFLFSFLVIGVSGGETTESSILGLGAVLGPHILLIGAIFGVLAMGSSFLSLGNVLRETFQFDFKLNKILAWVLVMSIPLVVYLLDIVTFIEALGFAGGILGGIEGILMILLFKKAKKMGDRKPEFDFKLPKIVMYFMYLVFIGGIGYVIYQGIQKWLI